jgi:hypothetical protein
LQGEDGITIPKDDSPLQPGDYFVESPGMSSSDSFTLKAKANSLITSFYINDELIIVRTMSSKQTGLRVQAFCDSVRRRDRRCVVTKEENSGAEFNVWDSFEAVHIFPLSHEWHWDMASLDRWG